MLDEALPFDDLNGNTWYDCTRPYDGLATRTAHLRAGLVVAAGE